MVMGDVCSDVGRDREHDIKIGYVAKRCLRHRAGEETVAILDQFHVAMLVLTQFESGIRVALEFGDVVVRIHCHMAFEHFARCCRQQFAIVVGNVLVDANGYVS